MRCASSLCVLLAACLSAAVVSLAAQPARSDVARFAFDGSVDNRVAGRVGAMTGGANVFVDGVAGRALRIGPGSAEAALHLESRDLPLGKTDNFSIQFWVRTGARADQRMVLLGQKSFPDNSLVSQKHAGCGAGCLVRGSQMDPAIFKRESVGSLANCAACHITAEKGIYDDDDVKIPK